MNKEIRQMCGLLKGADAELRCAAARVLGALAPEDDEVVGALAAAAGDENAMVRNYACDALKKLAKPKHASELLPLLDGPMRDRILPLVKELGGNPMAALKKGLDDPSRRLNNAQSIASLGGRQAFEALLKETSDPDIEYVKAVTNLLRTVIEKLDDADREKAYDSASQALSRAKERIAKVAAIRVLGYLRQVDAAEPLAKLTAAGEHASIRSHALHALAMLNYGTKKAPAALVKTLFGLLDDSDSANIVEPALQALSRLSLPETVDLEPLLTHPSPTVRLHGVKLLGARGDKDSGRRLIEMGEDRNETVKDEAMSALRREPKFAAMLATFMEKEGGKGGRTDLFASILKGYRDGLPKEVIGKFLEQGLALFEKDGQQNWALDVAKSAAPEAYKAALLEAGLKHKKAKKLEASERFLSQVIREGGGDEDARYELAVVRLVLSPKNPDKAARASSYPLAMLKDLAKVDAKGLASKMKKDALLTSAELMFAGLHFLETEGLKDFGAELLKQVVKSGKAKEASAAKAALKAVQAAE